MELKPFFKEIAEIIERNEEAVDILKKRLFGALLVMIVFFGLIIYRLWSLQIQHGADFQQKSFSNRVRIQEIAAPRGQILDRNGKEIVTNRPSFNVVLMREDSHDLEGLVKKLSAVLHEDISILWERIREASGTPLYMPVVLKKDIDWQMLAYLESHNQDFPGVSIEVQPVRIFNYGNLMANVIGYLGIISKAELDAADRTIYSGIDLVGKRGLEKLRESDLRGEKGSVLTEVDARGFVRQKIKNEDPYPGKDIHLTLDVGLQKLAEDMMAEKNQAGAAVVMDVKTGKILAAVSAPTIQLDQFVGGISKANWKALLDNPRKPLLNKVVQGTYPPGSTYKMITALAGLTSGAITKDTTVYCPGYYTLGNHTYRCWKHSGHGTVDLRRAVGESCDTYFYTVGHRVGVDGLAEFAKKMGLGEISGIELENEKSGLIPTKQWKKDRHKVKWQDGETLSVAIGQGYNLTTPLQICLMTATLATGGKRMQPQIIEKVVDLRNNEVTTFSPKVAAEIPLNANYMEFIRQGMMDVVQGARGTARKVAIKGLNIAGKTGTAQVVKLAQVKGLKEEAIPYKYRDHAWFTCYAPAEKPEIAVTVLVEHGLHGGSGAGPIARAIMHEYFKDRLPSEEKKGSKPIEESIIIDEGD